MDMTPWDKVAIFGGIAGVLANLASVILATLFGRAAIRAQREDREERQRRDRADSERRAQEQCHALTQLNAERADLIVSSVTRQPHDPRIHLVVVPTPAPRPAHDVSVTVTAWPEGLPIVRTLDRLGHEPWHIILEEALFKDPPGALHIELRWSCTDKGVRCSYSRDYDVAQPLLSNPSWADRSPPLLKWLNDPERSADDSP